MANSLHWCRRLTLSARLTSNNCYYFKLKSGVRCLTFSHQSKPAKYVKNERFLLKRNFFSTCVNQTNNEESIGQEKDSNDLALERLDITLLKPHPEWRNVAAGPVWGDGYFDLLWKEYNTKDTVALDKELHDKLWEEYIEEHGHSPIDYLQSADYKHLYDENTIWHDYVRPKKGTMQKQITRKSCIVKGEMSTGSPCPLCRDEKVLLTYKNLPLLHQFIDRETGELHSSMRTGLCRLKWKMVNTAFDLAREMGYMPRRVHYVRYNLDNYRVDYHSL